MSTLLSPADDTSRNATWNSVHAAAVDTLPSVLRLLGVSEPDIDDLFQEILLAAYESLDRFDPAFPASTSAPLEEADPAGDSPPRDGRRQQGSAEARWVFGIAWRKVSRYLDRAYRRREVPTGLHPAPHEQAVDPAPSSEQRVADRERLELAIAVLGTIAPERRILLVLHEAFDVPVVEIARMLGINYNTACNRLRLAREDYRAAVARLRPEQRQALRACWLLFPLASDSAIPRRPADGRAGAAPHRRPGTPRASRAEGAGRSAVAMSCTRPRHGLGARHARCAAGSTRGAGRPARVAVAAAMATTVLLCVAAARAAPELRPAAMRLEVVRGPGAEACADEAFLRAEVARGLGADPFQDDAPRVLTVTIAQAGPELTASMALRESESAGDTTWAEGFGTRNGCEALLSGAALAIVAQILNMPERAPPPFEASPEPEPSAPPSPPPPQTRRAAPEPVRRAEHPKAPKPPEAAPSPPEPLRIEAGLGATLGLGITPGAAAGMTLSFGVRRPAWSVAVEGRGLVSVAQEVEAVPLGTSAFTMAAVGCLRSSHLFGCGVASVGVVRFAARSPWNLALRNDALLGCGARLGSDWPLSDTWSAHGYAEATVIVADAVLRRQSDPRNVPGAIMWSSPPLAATLGLGITAAF